MGDLSTLRPGIPKTRPGVSVNQSSSRSPGEPEVPNWSAASCIMGQPSAAHSQLVLIEVERGVLTLKVDREESVCCAGSTEWKVVRQNVNGFEWRDGLIFHRFVFVGGIRCVFQGIFQPPSLKRNCLRK
ncbi:hypothetical protein TNCV_2564791, partial [Trichonephila clavipes]